MANDLNSHFLVFTHYFRSEVQILLSAIENYCIVTNSCGFSWILISNVFQKQLFSNLISKQGWNLTLRFRLKLDPKSVLRRKSAAFIVHFWLLNLIWMRLGFRFIRAIDLGPSDPGQTSCTWTLTDKTWRTSQTSDLLRNWCRCHRGGCHWRFVRQFFAVRRFVIAASFFLSFSDFRADAFTLKRSILPNIVMATFPKKS